MPSSKFQYLYKKNSFFILQTALLLIKIMANEVNMSLFLQNNESAIVIPHKYIDQDFYTDYIVEGAGFIEHQPLQLIRKYTISQILPANNSQFEPLIDMIKTEEETENQAEQQFYIFYISSNSFLRMARLNSSTGTIKELFETSLTKQTFGNSQIENIKAIRENLILLWTGKKSILIQISPLVGVSDAYYADGYRSDLTRYLDENIVGCSVFIKEKEVRINLGITQQRFMICFDKKNIVQLQRKSTDLGEPNGISQLDIVHRYEMEKPIENIVNCLIPEEDILAVCDRFTGCYNFRMDSGQLNLLYHKHISQQILFMKEAINNGGTEDYNIAISSNQTLYLINWFLNTFESVNAVLVPTYDKSNGSLMDIQVVQKYVLFKLGNTIGKGFVFLFGYLSEERSQYVEINKVIVARTAVIVTQTKFLMLPDTKSISMYNLNPYYLNINSNTGQQSNRSIIVHVYHNSTPWISIVIQVNTVIPHTVYINNVLDTDLTIKNTDSSTLQTIKLFKGPINKFVYNQTLMPYVFTDVQSHKSADNNKSVVYSRVQDHLILSIYSLLDIITMESTSDISFMRYMLAPTYKVYIQQCTNHGQISQYICTLVNIVPLSVKSVNYTLSQIMIPSEIQKIWQKWIDKKSKNFIIATDSHCYQSYYNDQDYELRYSKLTSNSPNFLYLLTSKQSNVELFVIEQHNEEQKTHKYLLPKKKLKKCSENISMTVTQHGKSYLLLGFSCDTTIISATLNLYTYLLSFNNHQTIQNPQIRTSIAAIPFKQYIFVFNNTHLFKFQNIIQNQCKYPVFIYPLPHHQGQFDVIPTTDNQYVMLKYSNSYTILNLVEDMLDMLVDSRNDSSTSSIIAPNQQLVQVYVDKKIVSYRTNLQIKIGPFDRSAGKVRDHYNIFIQGEGKHNNQKQRISLTVDHIGMDLSTRTDNIKKLDVPYQCANFRLIIYETMFNGPIQEYYITDTFDDQILLINHLQKTSLKELISYNLTAIINSFNYFILSRNNAPTLNLPIVYTNSTHILIVDLQHQVILDQIGLENPVNFNQYWVLQCSNHSKLCSYVLLAHNQIIYISHLLEKTLLNTFHIPINITIKYSMVIQSLDSSNHKLLVSLRKQADTTPYISYIQLKQLQPLKFASFTPNISFLTASAQSRLGFYLLPQQILCIDTMANILSPDQKQPFCISLTKIISPQYYLTEKSLSLYNQIQILQQSPLNQSQYIFIILLLSDTFKAEHIELTVDVVIQYQIEIKVDQVKVSNCYDGISDYEIQRFLGIGHKTDLLDHPYDFFIIRYVKKSNNKKMEAFYRINEDYDKSFCGEVSGWVQLQQNSVLLQTQKAKNNSYYLLATSELFKVNKNICILLNYQQPLPMSYLILHAHNPVDSISFYSKFVYAINPQEIAQFEYWWVGFVFVAGVMIFMRILRALTDKGIIKWNSASSDEDSASPPNTFTVGKSLLSEL